MRDEPVGPLEPGGGAAPALALLGPRPRGGATRPRARPRRGGGRASRAGALPRSRSWRSQGRAAGEAPFLVFERTSSGARRAAPDDARRLLEIAIAVGRRPLPLAIVGRRQRQAAAWISSWAQLRRASLVPLGVPRRARGRRGRSTIASARTLRRDALIDGSLPASVTGQLARARGDRRRRPRGARAPHARGGGQGPSRRGTPSAPLSEAIAEARRSSSRCASSASPLRMRPGVSTSEARRLSRGALAAVLRVGRARRGEASPRLPLEAARKEAPLDERVGARAGQGAEQLLGCGRIDEELIGPSRRARRDRRPRAAASSWGRSSMAARAPPLALAPHRPRRLRIARPPT